MQGEATDLFASTPEVARALSNVLDNAVRHTPPGGTVTVEAGLADGIAFVAVQDECGGIRSRDLDRVFEPAFRGEVARTPRGDGGGAGLGLAIARGIVEAHRGDISVANERRGCRPASTVMAVICLHIRAGDDLQMFALMNRSLPVRVAAHQFFTLTSVHT